VEHFGSTEVHSFDNSDYEGASHVLDLNEPLPSALYEQYDTVIDAGSMEHIADTMAVLENLSQLLKPGGQIIHVNPSNNFCGHGFYQFSPEFYFSAYSSLRGFTDLEVFLAKASNSRTWFQVTTPGGGQRVEVTSGLPLICLVHVQKATGDISFASFQQSDYIHNWDLDPALPESNRTGWYSKIKAYIKKNPRIYGFAIRAYFSIIASSPYQIYFHRWKRGFNSRNKWLTRVSARQVN